jgi:hypothetical protein
MRRSTDSCRVQGRVLWISEWSAKAGWKNGGEGETKREAGELVDNHRLLL